MPLSKEERLEARREWIEKLDLLVNDIWPLIKKVGRRQWEKREIIEEMESRASGDRPSTKIKVRTCSY